MERTTMSEERRAVIEAALHGQMFKGSPLQLKNPAELAEQIEQRLAEWERTREPTDAEIRAVTRMLPVDSISYEDGMEWAAAALRAARDVKENTDG
jgi:hypothetical protein